MSPLVLKGLRKIKRGTNHVSVDLFNYRPSPVKLSPLGEKVREGQYLVRQKGGTISRTVGGWPFWCEEGRAKVVPATPLKLSPPALKLSVGQNTGFFFGEGTISRGRVGTKSVYYYS